MSATFFTLFADRRGSVLSSRCAALIELELPLCGPTLLPLWPELLRSDELEPLLRSEELLLRSDELLWSEDELLGFELLAPLRGSLIELPLVLGIAAASDPVIVT